MLGRSRPFDKLLADHRAAKEASLRRKMSVKLGLGSPAAVPTPDSHSSAVITTTADYKSLLSPAVTSPSNSSPDVEPTIATSTSPRVVTMERSPSPPVPAQTATSSWRSAWKARCSLLRSARLFRVLAPSHFAPATDDRPARRSVNCNSVAGFCIVLVMHQMKFF